MNSSILTAIESLCDDIATNTNADDNKKRAEAVVSLAFAGTFTPAEYEDEYKNSDTEITRAALPKPGDRFTYNGIEFVALGEEQGGILAVVSERLGDKMPFDKNDKNNWKGSTLRKYLNDEYLQNFNKGDLLPFVSDLTADDGTTDYGTSEDYIAILSDNLYRKYRAVMPRYDTWVWSITPYSCLKCYADYERIVNVDGSVSSNYADYASGVAPACIFNPKFFE